MSPVSIGLLAFVMSVDAFVASVGRGAGGVRPGLGGALRAGAVFGLVEMLTPLVGWSLGILASGYVEMIDHWIAFGLLAGVGVRMVLHAFEPPQEDKRARLAFWGLVATAFGTSIDAMAVGVSMAFVEVNIMVVAAAFGVATLMMSTMGLLAGRVIGRRFGPVADVAGGLVLIGLGASILLKHLAAG